MRGHVAVLGWLLVILISGHTVTAQSARVRLASWKAEQFKQKAEALYEQPRQLHRAAELHEQEAALRGSADPRQVDALERAARLYAYAGDVQRGRFVMERAARQALRRGDVARAANALIDAAFIALQEGDRKLAMDFTQEAEMLVLSPLLTAEEKAAIVRRIDPARVRLVAMQ